MKHLHALPLFLAVTLLLATSALLADGSCPPEGRGGDPVSNRLKNRTAAPTSYTEMDVPQFLKSFAPNLDTPKYRDRFARQLTDYIGPREQQGIALSGYLIMAAQAGIESSNCDDRNRRDFHIWIGEIPEAHKNLVKAARARAVIVEVTPPWQDRQDTWYLRTLQKLAREGAKVRISGWAFYDPEHPNELGKTRATLWEVHPVTRIEVWADGGWRPL